MHRKGNPWAYCEVKTVWRHSWAVRVLHEDRVLEERVEVSEKPVHERLSGDLVTAIRQLRSGNPDHALLNIVLLVNRDPEASLNVLARLFSTPAEPSERGLEARRAARLAAEIRGFRRDVDLCLWMAEQADGRLAAEGYFLFNPKLQEQANEIAGMGSAKLVVLLPAA
ncbi:MAG: hypothetical protein WCE75_14400 [Terracidiphilus sp.]